MNEHFRINGLICAVFTPFGPEGKLNLKMIRPYAAKLLKENVSGIFVCGSTGECRYMSVEEREAVLDAWLAEVKGKMLVISHIGGCSREDSITLGKYAASRGVDAVGSIAPYDTPFRDAAELADYFVPIAASASPVPFYYYHIPAITGLKVSMMDFLEAGSKLIPNLNGIKFTSNDFMEMMNCIRYDGGRFNILNGYDEMLLCGLAVGAQGGVGSTYNYIYGTYAALKRAFEEGDIARARDLQYESVKMVNVIIRHGGGIRGGKGVMKFAGLDCGDCRGPVAPYSKKELAALEKELKEIGFI
ncbi:MAG: dihydrodipicolinate synthase family protein [Bacteroidales bacterium]|jgi:N-acetylneuraminate lyase|nr:dihydrodipicolinate synthase family protein [Bacteroidales bacterium]MCI2121560.1 dihydrodipicolinate synthase family protein [Bacteroidales bacterium]MCI2145073.1 dihydrodipicolinate synthase family protein [Bacteroidales bacterium]